MHADQAIFTSLERRGKAGYHLVSRSAGVSEAEAVALGRWCPSHGGLATDEANRSSVNYHALPSGRFVVSRTIAGRSEFSGRGGRQVYTHALLVDIPILRRVGTRPMLVYHDAMALGYLIYQSDPPATLPKVPLSQVWRVRRDEGYATSSRALGLPVFDSLINQLQAGQSVVVPYAGDRIALAESLFLRLEPELILASSFATSLKPSSMRPFLLHVVPPALAGAGPPGDSRPRNPSADL